MTREVLKIKAIASEYGNSSHIITPRAWKGKRVVAMLHAEWDEMRGKGKENEDE
jgi:hypothetical protein